MVAETACRRGVSTAAVIREAIDGLPDQARSRRAAVDALLAAEPMPQPAHPEELRGEIEANRATGTE